MGHYKGLRANAESAIFSIRIDTTTRQKYQTQFPREEKNRYKNRMKLRMARDEKKMSNDGCTTALTIWARWRWAFHCDITFIIPQRTVFTDKKNTTESRYILIPFVSAHKVPPNQIGLAFLLLLWACRQEIRRKKNWSIQCEKKQFAGLTHVRVFQIGLNQMTTTMTTMEWVMIVHTTQAHSGPRWCWMSHLQGSILLVRNRISRSSHAPNMPMQYFIHKTRRNTSKAACCLCVTLRFRS